jgi:hypothetical protein
MATKSCLQNKRNCREGNEFCFLEFGSDAAGAQETPAANGLKNGEQARHHQNQTPQRVIARNNDARDEAQRTHDTARHAAVVTKVGMKKAIHAENLAHCVPKKQAIVRDTGQSRQVAP